MLVASLQCSHLSKSRLREDVRRIFRFRNLQQKLGIYSFLVSLLALTAVSVLSYRIARAQIQSDREQLMEIETGQIVQQLEDELTNTVREVQLWGEMDTVQAGLKSSKAGKTEAFLDDLVKREPKYDLIFTVDRDGRIMSINTAAASADGKPYQFVLPDAPANWFQDIMQTGSMKGALGPFDWKSLQKAQLAYVNELYNRTAQNSPAESRYQFALGSPIVARGTGEKLGVIVAIVNWSDFQRILDGAETRFKGLGLTT